MELINLIRQSYIAKMAYNPWVLNHQWKAHLRDSNEHDFAAKNGEKCWCLNCRVRHDATIKYGWPVCTCLTCVRERRLAKEAEAKFVTTNALWAW